MLNHMITQIKDGTRQAINRIKFHHNYADYAIRRSVWTELYREHLNKYLAKATPLDPNTLVNPDSVIRYLRTELSRRIRLLHGGYIGSPNTIYALETVIIDNIARYYKEPYPRMIAIRDQEWHQNVQNTLLEVTAQYPTFPILYNRLRSEMVEQHQTPSDPHAVGTGPLGACTLLLALILWASRAVTALDFKKLSDKDAKDIQEMIDQLDIMKKRPSHHINGIFLATFENKIYDTLPFANHVVALIAAIDELEA